MTENPDCDSEFGTDERITVAFFHISYTFGGASKMLLRLLRSLDQDTFEPVLVSQEYDEVCRRAEENGIRVHVIPFKGSLDSYNRQLSSLSVPQLFRVGYRILQYNTESRLIWEKADVIWCQNLRAVLTLLPHILIMRTPVIWNVGLGNPSGGNISYLQSIAFYIVDYVFIESETQAKRVFTPKRYEQFQEKFVVFHKGIDTTKFDPDRVDTSTEDDVLIGTAATITPRKGLEYLIDSFSGIVEEYPNARLVIAGKINDGDEEYRRDLGREIREQEIQEHVEFVGWVEDMPSYLASLDVFVLPSLNEGVSGAIREAMAMELPVIATDVGGNSDAIVDGKTGYLVPPKDSRAISKTVLHLLDNPSKSRKIADNARKRVKNDFSVESYIENYEAFLLSVRANGDSETLP